MKFFSNFFRYLHIPAYVKVGIDMFNDSGNMSGNLFSSMRGAFLYVCDGAIIGDRFFSNLSFWNIKRQFGLLVTGNIPFSFSAEDLFLKPGDTVLRAVFSSSKVRCDTISF